MSKLMMLVAAKWREFSNINPNLQSENEPSTAPSTTSEESYPKSNRSRASKEAAQKIVEADSEPYDEDDDFDDDEDKEDKSKKKRGSRGRPSKSSKKATKVPTLKIKLGKRKRGSSVSDLFLIMSILLTAPISLKH